MEKFIPNILNSYDSTLEIDILETYLRNFSKFNQKKLNNKILILLS